MQLIRFLRLARRFTDPRNPELEQKLRVNGDVENINITDRNLKISWVIYRVWIRLLSYRSIKMGRQAFGKEQLLKLLKILSNRYYHEVKTAVPIATQQNNDHFGLKEMLDLAENQLEVFADEFWKLLEEYNVANNTEIGIRTIRGPDDFEVLKLLVANALAKVGEHSSLNIEAI